MSEITEIEIGSTYSSNHVWRVLSKQNGMVTLEYNYGNHWLPGHPISEADVIRNIKQHGGRLLSRHVPAAPAQRKRVIGGVTPLQQQILEALSGPMTTGEIAKVIGKPTAAANSALNSLKLKGMVACADKTPDTDVLTWSKA